MFNKKTDKKAAKKVAAAGNNPKRHGLFVLRVCFAAVVLAAAVLLIVYKTAGFDMFAQKASGVTFDAELWFRDKDTLKWVKETRKLTGGYDKAMFDSVITALWANPRSDKLLRAVPRSVNKAEGFLVVEEDVATGLSLRVAVLDFDDTYWNMPERDRADFAAAAAWTLTSLRFVDAARVTVNGEPVKTAAGAVMGLLTRDNVRLDIFTDDKTVEMTATLYFPSKDGIGLVRETRDMARLSGETAETRIVYELIRGPITIGLSPVIPKETLINSTKVYGGVCFVDLSSDFTTKLYGTDNASYLAVQSIVASLTESPTVRRVQFLIDGERVEPEEWTIDISSPLERDDSVIIH